MDRRDLLIAGAAAIALGGCGGARTGPLAPGQQAPGPAIGLRHATTLARGRLTYGAEFSRDGDSLTSVELGLAFKVVRRPTPSAARREKVVEVRIGEPTFDVTDIALGPRGRLAWVSSLDGALRRIDLHAARITSRWPIGDPVSAVGVSPDGARLALGTTTGVVCLRRVRDAALLQCVAVHGRRVSAVRFSRDGTRLVTSSWDGSVVLWRVPSLSVIARRPRGGSANDVALSPDGMLVAVARSNAPPIRTPAIAAQERTPRRTAARGAVVELWRPNEPPRRCAGHAGPVTGVAWTPDGKRVVSVSWDRSVRMWAPSNCRQLARVRGFGGPLWRVAVDRAGRFVAVSGWAGGLKDRSTALLELLYPWPPSALH